MYKQALITVFDKSGLAEFLRPIAENGACLVSTGGTARWLKGQGFKTQNVEDLTGFPEVLNGRVKTLHPHIHIALLARLWVENDREALKKRSLKPFDLVVGGLYPFEQKKDSCGNDKELAEWIDIGGPALLRAAAKNWFSVTTVCHPEDYHLVRNGTTLQQRKLLSAKVFKSLGHYNHIIAESLKAPLQALKEITSAEKILQDFKPLKESGKKAEMIKNQKRPDTQLVGEKSAEPISFQKKTYYEKKPPESLKANNKEIPLKESGKKDDDKNQEKGESGGGSFPFNQAFPLKTRLFKKLRYGENPSQSAGWLSASKTGLHQAQILQGKELSYNNILDLHSAMTAILDFDSPAAVFVKHNNPCGAAQADQLKTAVEKALKADPLSVFGAVSAFNRPLDEPSALLLKEVFIEALIAPDIADSALQALKSKKNLRVLKWPEMASFKAPAHSFQEIMGGLLVQTRDQGPAEDTKKWRFFGAEPSKQVLEDLIFSQKICKHLKSNAVSIVSHLQTLGLGMGQVSRVSAVESAISRWKQFHPSKTKDLVLAGDGFFPFADSIDLAGRSGISWIIQPGGSIKDKEVLKSASKWGINMVLTGKRLFKH